MRWSETTDEDSFRIGLGKGLVRISRWTDERDGPGTLALLINEEGKTVDMVVYGPDSPRDLSATDLDELFELARSSALDVDGLVGGMLESLEKGDYSNVAPEKKGGQKPKSSDDDIPF